MRKILYVSTSTTLGGAEKTLYTLATLIDPARFRVAGVVSLKPKGFYAERLEAIGHPVRSLDLKGRPGFAHLKALAEAIVETKPDVVHAIMYQAIQLCRLVKMLGYADFPLVSSPRVNYRTRGDWSLWLDARLKILDSVLVTESKASRDYLVRRQGYEEAKLATIYNGVDLGAWPASAADRGRVRERLKLAPEERLIGAVGRLDEQKGHRFLLEAVAKLRPMHPVRLVLVGDGPMRGSLEALARELRIQDAVVFAGEAAEAPEWMRALDVFVLPSLWEGLPNALLEAMAIGLPVVATQVDGIPEAVTHDRDGLLCPPSDSHALMVAIQDLLLDEGLRKRLGDEARRTVKERFKLSDMIAAYEGVYERVVG